MAKPKKALGRGLQSLIPVNTKEEKLEINKAKVYKAGGLYELKISSISPNSENPRKSFNEESIKQLSATIKSFGLIQPITVKSDGDKKFTIIAGERRYRACKLAGYTKIPAIVLEVAEKEKAIMGLVENIQRESLDVIEEAEHYNLLIKKYNLKQGELAEMVGFNRSTISNRLRLLNLPDIIKDKLADRIVSEGHIRPLLQIKNRDNQIKLLNKMISEKWNVRKVEEEVSKLQNPLDIYKKSKSKKDPAIVKMEDKLRSILGTKVLLKHNENSGKGKLQIDYYTVEDLERIISLIEK